MTTTTSAPISLAFAPADSAADATPPEQRSQRILSAVEMTVPKIKPPAGYGVAMTALAVFLVLLPLAYLALVAFLAWLLLWHVFQTFASFEYGPYFVFHVPMALLGGLLLLFLIKPVFFRRRMKDEGVIPLERDDEPLLFAFVERLSAATKAPAPAKIEVDCEPNAGARLHGGFRSVFSRRRDLVLRIGLPLMAAFTVRQFAGVLGHELGHFNQSRGMTGSYLIRRLTAFFAEIVFQRDRLDERLMRMRMNRNAFAQLGYWIAVALIEPARGVLWLMLLIGELLTCNVLRRMEYDADHVEAHVAGVHEFVNVSRMLLFLQLATRRAQHDLDDALAQQRLADDLPRLILAHARQLSEHRDDILKLLECGKTRWFDTHPCHNDRVRSVERTRAVGLVDCDLPAQHLFAGFDDLCQRATGAFYKGVLGRAVIEQTKLVPTQQLVEERSGQRESVKSLHRFFRGHVVAPRPVFPGADAIQPADDVTETVRELADARAQMLAAAGDAAPMVQQYLEAADTIPLARAQLELTEMFPGNPRIAPIRERASTAVMKHDPLLIQASHRLAPFERAARTRLTLGLRLAQREELASAFAGLDPDPRASLASLMRVLERLEASLPTVTQLRELAASLEIYFSAYDDANPNPQLVEKILETVADVIMLLDRLKHDMSNVKYPFEHGTQDVTAGRALVERSPSEKDPVDAHACAIAAVDRFLTLTFRCLANLTELVERVEQAVGLEPLSDPVSPQEQNAEDEKREKIEGAVAARETRRYWIGYGARAAAGLVLVGGLVALSVSPPTLPTMPWERAAAGQSRPKPARFYASVPLRHYTTYAPAPASTMYRPGGVYSPGVRPAGWPNVPDPNAHVYGGVPQQPGFPANSVQPGFPGRSIERRPGYQPPQRGYPQPGYNEPYRPGQPGRYQPGQPPTRHNPPGPYNPSRGSGGAPQPGGGASGGAGGGAGGGGRPGGR